MAQRDLHACLFQLCRGVGLLEVASADIVAPGEEDAGQRRHPGATGPHKVNLHRRATSRRTPSTRSAASRLPAAEEASAIARSRSGSSESIAWSSVSPLSSP